MKWIYLSKEQGPQNWVNALYFSPLLLAIFNHRILQYCFYILVHFFPCSKIKYNSVHLNLLPIYSFSEQCFCHFQDTPQESSLIC